MYNAGMDVTEELTALRAEMTELKKLVIGLRDRLGLEPEDPPFPPPYCSLEAEMIAIRKDIKEVPIILKADEGEGGIYLSDKKHVARGTLQVSDNGARIELRNAAGKLIVTIGEAPDGSGVIFVHDKEGKPRAGLRATDTGGAVTTLNSAGLAQAIVRSREDGGEVLLADAEGRTRAKLHSGTEGGTIVVNEPSGRPVAYMTSHGDKGTFSVYNETGDQVGALSSDANGGLVILYDNDKVVRTSLPPISD
jgi:hypothetical protein